MKGRSTTNLIVKTLNLAITLAMVFSSFPLVGWAAVSPTNIITYQGRLLDYTGAEVVGASALMSFSFYDALSGGTCLWSNNSTTCASVVERTVTLTNALFTENLGDTTIGVPYAAVADTVFSNNASIYLEVTVNGETLSPRKRLTASAYALNSQTLDGLDSTDFLSASGDTGTGTFDFTGDLNVTLSDGSTASITDDGSGTAPILALTGTSLTADADILNISLTQSNGAGSGADNIGLDVLLTGNDTDGDLFGLVITGAATANAGAGTYEAGIKISNLEDTAGSMPDGIIISASTNTAITDAIDVSDAEIVNALNVGANDIIGTTGLINLSNFDVAANGEIITADDLHVNGDNIDADGDLTITGATGLTFIASASDATLDAVTSLSIDVTGATGASNISVVTDADAEDLTIETTGTEGDVILSAADDVIIRAVSTAGGSITLDAFDGGVNQTGSMNLSFGSGNLVVSSEGVASGDFLLDADLISIDGTGTSNISVTGAVGEDFTLSQIGAADASLILSSTGTGADALQITTTAGGIDILNGGAAGGEDIDISSTLASINLTAGEAAANAIVLNASNAAGGIDIDYGTGDMILTGTGVNADFTLDTDFISIDGTGTSNFSVTGGVGEDFTISQIGVADASLILSSTGTGADALQISTSAGGMDITVAGAAAGEDLDLTSNSSINLTATEAVSNAINIFANAEGGAVVIRGGDTADASTADGNDVFIGAEDDVIIDANDDLTFNIGDDYSLTSLDLILTGTETTDINATNEGITIDATDSDADGGGTITLTGNDGVTATATTGTLALNAAAANMTLDAVTSLSIDVTGATGASNISVVTDADAEDLTIETTGTEGDVILSAADDVIIRAVSTAGGSITLDAFDGGVNQTGSMNLSFGSGNLVVSSEGVASGDFLLDADLISIDGTGTSNISVTGAVGEDFTVSQIGAADASLILSSTGTGADALQITTTAGGIDILNGGAAGGEDIDISSTLASINLTAGESAVDSIVISSTIGGIDITAAGAAAGEDIDILATGSSINLTSTEGAADGLVFTSTNGGMDLTTTGAVAGEDIDVTSSASLNLIGQEAAANAIVLNASNAAGGIDIDYGTGDMILTGTGVNADFTLDTDFISIDGTGTSNFSVTGGVGEDFTVSQIGAADASLILSSTGTGAAALQISTSAGGLDITVAGAAADEDLDLLSNTAINLSSTETEADSFTIFANAEGGAVSIRGGDTSDVSTANGNDVFIGAEDDLLFDANDDLSFLVADDFNLTALDLILTGTETTSISTTNEGLTIEATDTDADGGGSITLTGDDGIIATATTGALALSAAAANMTLSAVTAFSIDVSGATTGSRISVATSADVEDLTIETTGAEGDLYFDSIDDISLLTNRTEGGQITLNAYSGMNNSSGAINMTFGSGNMSITGGGASADFTLDSDLFSIDGTGTSNISVTGAVGEDFTVSQIGAADASLILSSTGTGADALQITTTAGGIDILNGGAAGGEDIDISSTLASINLTAGESAVDSIVISSTIGGIDITAAGAAAGEDIDILATGSSINLTSTEGAADGLVFTSTNGGMDLTTTGAVVGEDIDVTSSASLNLIGQEAVANAIVLNASNAAGGIDIDYGTGDMILTGTGVNADFTLDTDFISIDGTGTSNFSVTGGVGEDFTVSQIGAADASLILSSTGTGADALQISTSAGGIDILNGGAAGGEDIDISSTLASINLTAGEGAADAIVISAPAGGIDLSGLNIIDISSTNLGVNITGQTDVMLTATAGDVNLTTTSPTGDDIVLTSSDDIMLDADGSPGNMITLDAFDGGTNTAGALAAYFGSGDFTITGANASADFTLDADLISIDGTGASNFTVTGLAGEDLSFINNGGSLILTATEAVDDAIVIQAATAAGGIDITSNADLDITTTGVPGEDISIINTGGSIVLTATEAATDAIVIQATTILGGIDIIANEDIDITNTGGPGNDISITNNSGSVNISATEVALDAINVDSTGGIDIDSGDDIAIDLAGAAGEDILVTNTGGSISLTSTEGVADAIKINASDTAGGIDVDFGTTDMIITGTGGSADFTLDADLISIDSTGTSNVSVTGGVGEDFTISQIGAADASLILSSTGTGADALQISTSAGGIDITNGGAAGGEDIDISSTLASLNLTAGEGAADAIVLNASNPAGGIDVDFGTGDMILTGNGVGADLTINAETNFNSALNIPDDTQIILGTGDDATISWVNATSDLLFDNTNAAGSTLVQLGTDTTTTDFQILNNSSTPLFSVDGLGTFDLSTAVVTGDISTISYPAAKTPTGDVRGMVMDLQTNITGDENVDLTGFEMLLPALTSVTADTTNYNGYTVNTPGALVQNTLVGTIKWNGFRANLPDITQTTGSITVKGLDAVNGSITTAGTMVGVYVTTGAITTNGYQYGLKVVPSTGAGAGTLIGANIDSVTPGAGTEIGLSIGSGWDDAINVNSGKFVVDVSGETFVNLVAAPTLFGICHDGADVDAGTDTTRKLVACSAGPGDYAEWYETDGTVTPGDIVTSSNSTMTYNAMIVDPFTGIISTGTTPRTLPILEKASATNTAGFLAVASSSPIQTIGAELKNSASHPVPIALNGRVPVNATNEGGSIDIGDPITASSTSGYGMKATRAGMIIGYSLENFSAASGQIMILVSPEWYAGNILTSDGSSTLVSDTLVMNSLSNASSTIPGVASQIFALRGSGWDGATAVDLDMKIQTQVTDSSDYRLSIKNTTDTEVAYISNEGTMMLAGDLIVTGKLYPSDRGAAQTSKYIYYDGSTGAGGDMMRTNAAGWSTGSYDFAEMFPSTDVLNAGDVVVFTQNEESVGRSSETYSKKIAGIVSTRPGFLAGENKAGQFPVALAGRVPTKVNLEGGAIAVGDPLTTSSTSGYAMKASEAGQIVGYALEPYTGSGDGKITVFVNVGYFNGTATTSAPGVSNTASLLATGASANFTSLNLEGGIYMGGNDILNIGRLVGLADIWSIEEDGTIKTQGTIKTVITSYQNEKVETTALTSTGGVFVTLVGTTEIQSGLATVNFEEVDPLFNDVIATSAPIRVIVTPSGPVSLYVDDKTQNGFVIKQIGGSDSGISVDWMVTAYRKDFEPKEDEAVEVVEGNEGVEGITETTPEATVEPTGTVAGATTEAEGEITTTETVENPSPMTEPETVEEIIPETTEPVSEPVTETATEVPAESPTQTSDPTVGADGGVTTEPTSTDSASIDSSAQMGG